MCVANEDSSTTCVCPKDCPEVDLADPVCSSYDMDFNSTCELHKFACQYGIMMSVKNKGRCERQGSCCSLVKVCPSPSPFPCLCPCPCPCPVPFSVSVSVSVSVPVPAPVPTSVCPLLPLSLSLCLSVSGERQI